MSLTENDMRKFGLSVNLEIFTINLTDHVISLFQVHGYLGGVLHPNSDSCLPHKNVNINSFRESLYINEPLSLQMYNLEPKICFLEF